jgi:hypothetical protein
MKGNERQRGPRAIALDCPIMPSTPASTRPAAATRPALGRALGLLGWVGVLAAVIVGFTALGSGPLAPPALTDPAAWADWAAGREPVVVAFTILRLVVLATAWYLLGVTLLGAAARLLRWGRLVRVADLLTVPAVRRLLQSSLGLGLATAALAATPTADLTPVEPTVASVQLAMQSEVGPALGGSQVALTPLVDPSSTAVMRVVDGTAVPATWEVAAGQHFWSIAEEILEAAWERPATEAEVTGYWSQLVEANRDVLADPGNPDLLFPGQVVDVPTPPPAP